MVRSVEKDKVRDFRLQVKNDSFWSEFEFKSIEIFNIKLIP